MTTTVNFASFIDKFWDEEAIPTLSDYIRIPNVSHLFDAKWREHGHMVQAIKLFESFAKKQLAAVPGAKVDLFTSEDHTPLLFIEIPGTGHGNVFCYGHMDKQPGVTGWDENKGPWSPVIENGKLYGRGGGDDGYAMFAELSAVLALVKSGKAYPRTVIFIEADEESGSGDVPYYMETLAERIGTPDLIVALDSGCSNYEQLWLTSSLRGSASGTIKIEVLREGVHSGDCSGIVPSSFRIFRQLLSRIENEDTGEIKVPECFVEIPEDRMQQAKDCADIVGDRVFSRMPFAGNTKPMGKDNLELVLNRTWKPQLAVIAMDGYPTPDVAGNVLLPYTVSKISVRLPPTCEPKQASEAIAKKLTENVPYDAKVTYTPESAQSGWNAPDEAEWLSKALTEAADIYYGKPIGYMGEGGSIPFMADLKVQFPKAQFIVAGVLGPNANAHGPNEFLHIGMAKKLSASVAHAMAYLATSK